MLNMFIMYITIQFDVYNHKEIYLPTKETPQIEH